LIVVISHRRQVLAVPGKRQSANRALTRVLDHPLLIRLQLFTKPYVSREERERKSSPSEKEEKKGGEEEKTKKKNKE
jgi:hypothetical protein